MSLLGIKAGPMVGRAYNFMLNLRLDDGPLGEEIAGERLQAWWAEQPESQAGEHDK